MTVFLKHKKVKKELKKMKPEEGGTRDGFRVFILLLPSEECFVGGIHKEVYIGGGLKYFFSSSRGEFSYHPENKREKKCCMCVPSLDGE